MVLVAVFITVNSFSTMPSNSSFYSAACFLFAGAVASGLVPVRAALVRVATVGVVTLVGAIVDVGLDRVIQREGGLALAFSVSFVERVIHIVRREMATTPVETKKNVRDGRSVLEKRSDIAAKCEPTVLSRNHKGSPGEHTYVSWAKK